MNAVDECRAGSAIEKVVLPLDGTRQAMGAIPIAKHIAELADATLHIVHVTSEPITAQALREALHLSREQAAGTVIEGLVGQPAECIARSAHERESLIVMTMKTARLDVLAGLGPVAEGVLRRCPCPILLVKENYRPSDWRLHHVLLPQDGTPSTAVAAGTAVQLARDLGAKLLVVHVSETKGTPSEPGTLTVPQYMDQPQHEWPAWSEEFLERVHILSCVPEELGLRLFLRQGKPSEEIVRTAIEQRADLIVLPWHGSLEERRAVTLKGIIRDAPCPLLIVPFNIT